MAKNTWAEPLGGVNWSAVIPNASVYDRKPECQMSAKCGLYVFQRLCADMISTDLTKLASWELILYYSASCSLLAAQVSQMQEVSVTAEVSFVVCWDSEKIESCTEFPIVIRETFVHLSCVYFLPCVSAFLCDLELHESKCVLVALASRVPPYIPSIPRVYQYLSILFYSTARITINIMKVAFSE